MTGAKLLWSVDGIYKSSLKNLVTGLKFKPTVMYTVVQVWQTEQLRAVTVTVAVPIAQLGQGGVGGCTVETRMYYYYIL